MSRFIQLHMLTSYPPANLNRDDLGRPKTAKMGGYDRLRVSSQCLKRTWRTSEIFENEIKNGVRTKMIGVDALNKLSEFPALSKSERESIAKNIAKVFGSLKGESLELDTLAFVSHSELENIDRVVKGFENGLGSATVESNAFGVKLYEVLSKDISTNINELISILKRQNGKVFLKKDWAKLFNEIIKDNKFKTSEDKSPFDYLGKLVENATDWIDNIKGDDDVPIDQLELYFAKENVKLSKEILKALKIGGALLSGKAAKEIEYGELKHKNYIKLCDGWEEQIVNWIENVQASEDDDYTSDENILKLKLVVSPGAIPKSAILTNEQTNADIALFGRMLADSPNHNMEAACQVAHAISVHPVVIEDDYFTAVEEMNQYRNDAGAAHIGETRFAAGLFYSYICINKDLLIRNLINNFDEDVDISAVEYDNERKLANRAIRALTEAAVKVAPEGKQNSFASRAYASFVLAEKGDQQPRSLSVAYLKPINHRENDDFIRDAIDALIKQRDCYDNVYGKCADENPFILNAYAPTVEKSKDDAEQKTTEEKTLLEQLLDYVSA